MEGLISTVPGNVKNPRGLKILQWKTLGSVIHYVDVQECWVKLNTTTICLFIKTEEFLHIHHTENIGCI